MPIRIHQATKEPGGGSGLRPGVEAEAGCGVWEGMHPPSTYGRSLLTGSDATSRTTASRRCRSLGPALKKTTEP